MAAELFLILFVAAAFLLLAFAELFWSLAERYLGLFISRLRSRDEQLLRSLASANAVACQADESQQTNDCDLPTLHRLDREREVRLPLFDKRRED